MRHFAHHIGDYAAATAHLSFVEDAAYHRLLRRYYQDEKPLPTEFVAAQRLVGARSREEREAVKNVLEEFFTLTEQGWEQARAAREIEAYHVRAETARENGNRGGRPPKPATNPEKTQRVSAGKLTNNQEPRTNNQSERGGADAPAEPTRARGSINGKSGTRIPEGWRPDAAGCAYASDRGLDPNATADAFADWWLAANGPTALKRDWNAAFRTWCRRDATRTVGQPSARRTHAPRGNDAFYEQLATIASRDRDDGPLRS